MRTPPRYAVHETAIAVAVAVSLGSVTWAFSDDLTAAVIITAASLVLSLVLWFGVITR